MTIPEIKWVTDCKCKRNRMHVCGVGGDFQSIRQIDKSLDKFVRSPEFRALKEINHQ